MPQSVKGDIFKCSGCGIEVEYSGIGFEPMEHNIDIGEEFLKNCGKFISVTK